ncbi:MAG: iron uptake porin [Leptolyngbyaceae cyanobacterium bins.302]|nr:iron uptake porin [Leptolyngbyaceae cyanobacterium bins.302]
MRFSRFKLLWFSSLTVFGLANWLMSSCWEAATAQTDSINSTQISQLLTTLEQADSLVLSGGRQINREIASSKLSATLEEVASVAALSEEDSLPQVTSVSQFSDVRPTDWAFQALQSLVERYSCIVGYPDKTYRGNRALSRYEFAAGLNACLDKIQELIAAATADFVRKEDLEVVKRLQEEFAAELAALRGRVESLEVRTATLEKQQFSTTTKLYGQVIFGVQGRGKNRADLNVRNGIRDTDDPSTQITFGYNTQLSLVTSFSPRDFLLLGLQAGNINTGAGFNNAPFFLNDTYTRLGYELNTNGGLRLSDATYRVALTDKLAFVVGAEGVNPVTVFRGPNRYESAGQGPISAFAQRNPIIGIGNTQTGVGFDWQFANWGSLQAVYSAGNGAGRASDPSPRAGLFNGPYTAGVQLALTPLRRVDLTLYYLNSYSTNAFLNTGVGDDLIGFVGSRFNTNAVGGTVSWRVSPVFTIGGWYGYTNSKVVTDGFNGNVTTANWMAFLNFPDLLGKGNLGGIYVGQPPKITSSNLRQNGIATLNIPSAISGTGGIAGGQPDSTLHVEAFYRLRVNDNISITPGVLVLFNPVQTSSSDTIVIGALRTTFSF